MFGEKKTCPVCGGKLGFFGSVALKDGKICDRCVMMAEIARGELKTREETLVSMNRYIWDFCNERDNLKEKLGENVCAFRVESIGITQLEEILVGKIRARNLNGKVHAYGYVISGLFREKAAAYIIHDGLKIPVRILAASAGNEKDDLNLLISKDQLNDPVPAPAKAKLVLDINNPDMVGKGDYIILKG